MFLKPVQYYGHCRESLFVINETIENQHPVLQFFVSFLSSFFYWLRNTISAVNEIVLRVVRQGHWIVNTSSMCCVQDMRTNRCHLQITLDYTGLLWITLVYSGLHWITLDYTGLLWIVASYRSKFMMWCFLNVGNVLVHVCVY